MYFLNKGQSSHVDTQMSRHTDRKSQKQTVKQVDARTGQTGRQIENQSDTGGILMTRSTDVSDTMDN